MIKDIEKGKRIKYNVFQMEMEDDSTTLLERSLKPEKIPRQHAFIYMFLLICTAILIYFYSSPLNDSSNSIRLLSSNELPADESQKEVFQSAEDLDEYKDPTRQIQTTTVITATSSNVLDNTRSILDEASDDSDSETESQETQNVLLNDVQNENEKSSTHSIRITTDAVNSTDQPTKQANPIANNISYDQQIHNTNGTTVKDSSTEQSFLVFSKHCKIPDIDPFHPSILGYVEQTPPLNCMKEEPLTKTEGNTLYLDKEAARKRHLNLLELMCKYMEVSRARDGRSDDAVGTGPPHKFVDKAEIKAEFIKVTCSLLNGTQVYEEYHSFIHNKSRVEKRCKNQKNSGYSVLIIGIDAMSRMNMHRQLKNTSRYLLENMKAVEMYGFNKVGDNTFPNLIPLLLGYDERELEHVCWNSSLDEPLDKCNFLWKRFAEKGYRTLYAEDVPKMSSFNYLKKGFYNQPTDYYFRHFMLHYEKALARNKKMNTYECIGSTSETEAVLHWTELFASNFRNRSYFSFSWINSLTHDFLNMGSAVDHMYERFFRNLHGSGILNKTITIVMGDHGMRWGSIRRTYIGRLEERLPMLLIALPEEFKKEFPKETEALIYNSHRLVTPFDLHATLVNVLHLRENFTFTNPDKIDRELARNFTKRAQTLFQSVPEDRSCDDAFIDEHWCTCETSLPMDPDNINVVKAADFLVAHVNSLLKPVSKDCAVLKLKSITDSRVWLPSSEHQGHSLDDTILTVIVKVKPSEAIFEGTVRVSAPAMKCELLGTVSRLNLYGKQSACVKDAILRKYCYCKDDESS